MAYVYRGLRIDQQPGAPDFYMTSVPAAEILEWCDVPRAKGDYMAGYQRVLDERRTADLAQYLRLSPNNILPGAIIVTVDSDYVEVSDVTDGLHEIRIADDTRDFETKLQELWGSFTTRLGEEELESAQIDFSTGSEVDSQTAPSGEVEGTAVDGVSESTAELDDIGETSVVAADDDGTAVVVDDEVDVADADEEDDESEVFPSSYLATLAQELSAAIQDWNSVPEERRAAIRSFIDGVSKPGLIIDGQHRVFGAKDVSDHDVILPVVLLPGLHFSEQVFEFYVLNSKARPLKPTELRRIVSTSLTNREIEMLYDRFKAAGIEAEEARWTLELNTRPESPFRGRIDFGYGETGAVIPENVADQVVRAFMKMPKSRYRQLINPLGERWTDPKQRLEIFFWFWNAIRSVYGELWQEAEEAADRGDKPQLFMKVSLLMLQAFVLDRFVTALPFRNETDDPPLSSEAEVQKMVRSTLTNLPAEFFRKEWKMKQIDTTEGRKLLYGFMEFVWNNQGKVHGNLQLFRGS